MFDRSRFRGRRTVFAFIAALALNTQVLAEEGRHELRTPLLPLYQQECASCHLAYPPGLLPAASWQRILERSKNHFGTDASLDAASTKRLSAWLVANAGTRHHMSEAPPEDRITRSNWFLHEHDELSAATWKRPAIKSASNCMACHVRADKGDFNEHEVRIPR